MKNAVLVFFVLLCPFIFSCASTPKDPRWDYEKDAITFFAEAGKDLNFKNKKAHALVLCVYQLANPNEFNQLAESRDGIYKLLECAVYDPASVLVSKQVVANPGKDTNVRLDRAEGARYVGVVAGYYSSFDKNKITKLYKIPVITERRGFLWLRKVAKPGKLTINVTLGAGGIQDHTER